ncbi:MAG: hypothetical protein ACT4O0_12935 [Pseudonocardia sp.]
MLTELRRPGAVTVSCCSVPPDLRAHHDRLLRVDTDPDELLELLELAVTWGELDYSDVPVLGPPYWVDFARNHDWRLPDRAERIFSLAADVAARARPSAGLVGEGTLRANLQVVAADVVAI